ncbi:MAG TPA: aldose 1-epimerase [Planctomycetaceae bacterium]|nr:aldose 1-epimerase [Planctomycetaceae bacterium]
MSEAIVITDSRSGSTARVAPELGFNCFEFHSHVLERVVDVLDSSPRFLEGRDKPSHHGIPLLFPFPNRIRGGRFTWNGREYRMTPQQAAFDPTGNAIHGFCLDRPWRVTERDENFVTGQFQLSRDASARRELWPADFLIEVRYEVRAATLRADVRIANPGDEPLPWGFGTHPYFKVPLGPDSQAGRCLIQVPASEAWELSRCLPTGRRMPVPEDKDLRDGEYFGSVRLDDVLTDLEPVGEIVECVIIDEHEGLQVAQRFPSLFREVVVYTPPERNAVCLEPYTCVTDAVNLDPQGVDAGWRVLEPGGEFQMWIEIEAGLVIV